MRITIAESLTDVAATAWNRLAEPSGNPFLRHEFLVGLEEHGCLGERWGWLPRHLLAYEGSELVGAAPLYLKFNSYGEFVFDWSWADAWERAGGRYYPKLVSAIPYTPVSGPRLLTGDDAVREALAEAALELARSLEVSSLHWLFPTADETDALVRAGLLRRTGTQFHWHNTGYRDFTDFLDRFTAQKRKKLKRERRQVQEAGIAIEVLDGHSANDAHWRTFHRFYRDTFDRHGGHATLSEPFFLHLAATMPDALVLVLAKDGTDYVAGALNFRGKDTLYGRHWGCSGDYPSLHFEACYYTGIEYCIRHGLVRFEPGAQGEHKVPRGFEPVPTWSAHWLANDGFAAVVGRYLQQEQELIEHYMQELAQHLPYRQETG